LIAEGKPSPISYFIITNVSPGRDVHKYKAPVHHLIIRLPSLHPSFTNSREIPGSKKCGRKEKRKEKFNASSSPFMHPSQFSRSRPSKRVCEKYCQSCHNAPFPSVPTSHLDTGPKGKKIVKWKFQSGKGKAVRVPNEEKS